MPSERNLLNKLLKLLSDKGWKKDEFLIDQSYTVGGNYRRLDLILLYGFFPLAVFEIKNSATNVLDGESYLSQVGSLDIPFCYFYNLTGLYLLSANDLQPIKETDFPSPAEMWDLYCSQTIENDPRIYSIPDKLKYGTIGPQIRQVFAVRNAVQAVIDGRKRSVISMPKGSGMVSVVFAIEWKLVKSGFVKRVLHIAEDESQRKFLLENYGNLYETIDSMKEVGEGKVTLVTMEQVLSDQEAEPDHLRIFKTDLVILDSLRSKDFENATNIFSESAQLAINPRFVEKAWRDWVPVYTFTIEDAATIDLPEPPKGYKSLKLEEIAEIRRGIVVDRTSDETNGGTYYVLTGRNISSDGYLDLSTISRANFSKQKIFDPNGKLLRPDYYVKPGDILIADLPFSISEGLRCAVAPNDIDKNILFSNSLICIRITDTKISPNSLYEFFRSGTGASIVRRFATQLGSSVARIIPSQLSKIPVFIPTLDKALSDQEVLGYSSVKKQLKEVISLLNKVEETNLTEEEGSKEDRESQLSLIAEKIKNIYPILVPLKLHERVMSRYPMPIALAYRRFHDARFNTYEQVLRLRDVYEATSFYIYNVLLADFLNRLDMTKFTINDKGARKAYDDFGMASRLKFIEKILEISKIDSGKDLFIPEFTECSFASYADKLRSDFRNSLSHTATATESQQKKILLEFKSIVDNMLQELEFLSTYRLVRIPSFHFIQHKLVRRMEVYHGVSPELDENPTEDMELIKADRDHIVLLDAENNVLDLFPLYQLIASEDTRHETHMGFLKERKGSERKLKGESVQGAFEMNLEGFSDFETLIAKIPEKK